MFYKIMLGHHIQGCKLRLAKSLELNNNDSCEKLILSVHRCKLQMLVCGCLRWKVTIFAHSGVA